MIDYRSDMTGRVTHIEEPLPDGLTQEDIVRAIDEAELDPDWLDRDLAEHLPAAMGYRYAVTHTRQTRTEGGRVMEEWLRIETVLES